MVDYTPDDIPVRLHFARSLYYAGEVDRAHQVLTDSVQYDPDSFDIYFALMAHNIKEKQWSLAYQYGQVAHTLAARANDEKSQKDVCVFLSQLGAMIPGLEPD